jgi:hypothetical protein
MQHAPNEKKPRECFLVNDVLLITKSLAATRKEFRCWLDLQSVLVAIPRLPFREPEQPASRCHSPNRSRSSSSSSSSSSNNKSSKSGSGVQEEQQRRLLPSS